MSEIIYELITSKPPRVIVTDEDGTKYELQILINIADVEKKTDVPTGSPPLFGLELQISVLQKPIDP